LWDWFFYFSFQFNPLIQNHSSSLFFLSSLIFIFNCYFSFESFWIIDFFFSILSLYFWFIKNWDSWFFHVCCFQSSGLVTSLIIQRGSTSFFFYLFSFLTSLLDVDFLTKEASWFSSFVFRSRLSWSHDLVCGLAC
jgi:hypothetical protein